MQNKNFAHLHVHNEFSLLDGYGTAKQWATAAKQMGFEYLALTNHGNIDGCLKFQQACDEIGINPVLGSELYLVPDITVKNKKEKKRHIVILVKNQAGWEELCRIITKSNLEGFYGRPRVDYNTLLECDMSGWIVMTACIGSFLNDIRDPFSSRMEFIDHIQNQTDLYYEIMPHDHPKQIEYHQRMRDIWPIEEQLPLVATNDCHYIDHSDNVIQDVMLAINRNVKWNDPKRWAMDFRDLHFRSADEMVEAFKTQDVFTHAQITRAMHNSIKIAKACSGFRIERKPISLPTPPKYKGLDEQDVFTDMIAQGLEDFGVATDPVYFERAEEEKHLIISKGFEKYFLVVEDLVSWAIANDIGVGPGRGSVGGSLIAFLLGITEIDPIKYDLLFSRFISEDRADYPDIDLDFEKRKRHLVVEYLKKTYGEYNIAGISTFGHIAGRGAVRDIGRIFEIPRKEIDVFAKSIPYNIDNPLQYAVDKEEGQIFKKRHPQELYYVSRLDGQIRSQGQHAAGYIISKFDLRDGSACALRKGKGGEPAVNWDMEDAEYNGLIKLDVLGLSTLSVLDYAVKLINENENPDDPFHLGQVPMDDAETFRLISKGRLAGLFQLNGSAVANIIDEMGIKEFEDLCAINALARPGPLHSGMAKKFVRVKIGKMEPEKIHPIYDRITASTGGVLVYQEQVMQVISRVAGLSETTADKIRKIIAKKRDVDGFKMYWDMFLDGCRENKTFTDSQAERFWQELQEWAEYGFNKAHSVAYALIGYWTAWLKRHYPIEFYCAHMTFGEFDQNKKDKSKQRVVDEILKEGYRIMPPKVNKSDPCIWVAEGDVLYMPFTEIKGIGEANAEKCCTLTPTVQKTTRRGFLDIAPPSSTNITKNEEILLAIDAYNDESIPENINDYLEFIMEGGNPEKIYPNLVDLLGYNTNMASIEAAACLDVGKYVFIPPGHIRRTRFRHDGVLQCDKCDLRSECSTPVLSSIGQYNVFIALEAPGKDEDQEGKGAVGKAGQVLWNEIDKYGYNRRFFHVTNTCHCYPSQTKTPKKEHIDICKNWLLDEIFESDCRLVLACGNIVQYALTGRDSGIKALSGTTEWIDGLGLWVCWCMHPSSVLRQGGNREAFEKGIKNFIDKLELLK